ncbi:MAG: hypothetical protein OET63_12450, partial [Desulfobacterales bacterium]|nr:hypothetical protein [Desulfobacterales bacterium]
NLQTSIIVIVIDIDHRDNNSFCLLGHFIHLQSLSLYKYDNHKLVEINIFRKLKLQFIATHKQVEKQ